MPISNLGNGLRTSGIYKITIGKNFYYGSTQDFETRKYKHLQKLKTNKQHNPYMQSVYNKYGYVAEIRRLWENREMTQLAIAEKFGVSPPHISKMCSGLNWVRS